MTSISPSERWKTTHPKLNVPSFTLENPPREAFPCSVQHMCGSGICRLFRFGSKKHFTGRKE